MKKRQAAQLQRETLTRLESLQADSIAFHGADFVRFSPLWKDYQSKRRVRLVKTYHAIKAGRFVQDRHRRKSVNVDAFPATGATDTKSARGAERDKA